MTVVDLQEGRKPLAIEPLGASAINCCYAARDIGVSSTTTKAVDCPDLTFSDTHRKIAGVKISLNVNRRVVSPACIPGVLISSPNFNPL